MANDTAATAASASSSSSSSSGQSYDLTKNFLPNLDRHLVLPLLDFVESRGAYTHQDVLKAKYDLLKPTNMVTYVMGIKRELEGLDDNSEPPKGFVPHYFFA